MLSGYWFSVATRRAGYAAQQLPVKGILATLVNVTILSCSPSIRVAPGGLSNRGCYPSLDPDAARNRS